jgi:hypothetical protein
MYTLKSNYAKNYHAKVILVYSGSNYLLLQIKFYFDFIKFLKTVLL